MVPSLCAPAAVGHHVLPLLSGSAPHGPACPCPHRPVAAQTACRSPQGPACLPRAPPALRPGPVLDLQEIPSDPPRHTCNAEPNPTAGQKQRAVCPRQAKSGPKSRSSAFEVSLQQPAAFPSSILSPLKNTLFQQSELFQGREIKTHSGFIQVKAVLSAQKSSEGSLVGVLTGRPLARRPYSGRPLLTSPSERVPPSTCTTFPKSPHDADHVTQSCLPTLAPAPLPAAFRPFYLEMNVSFLSYNQQ